MKSKKIVLIGCGTILFVFLLVGGFFFEAFKVIGEMKDASATETAEHKRMTELPFLKGVLTNNSKIQTPISHDSVALLGLGFGYKMESVSPNYRSSKIEKVYDREPKVNLHYPNDLTLKIEGQDYEIDFKKCLMDKVNKKSKVIHKITKCPKLYTDSICELKQKRLKKIESEHFYIDFFYRGRTTELVLIEYKFNVGDTIYFKGKIENGRVIPLF